MKERIENVCVRAKDPFLAVLDEMNEKKGRNESDMAEVLSVQSKPLGITRSS